jgi:hypothetical protein
MPQEMETEMNGVIAALLAKYDKLVHGDGTGVGGMGGASYKSFMGLAWGGWEVRHINHSQFTSCKRFYAKVS